MKCHLLILRVLFINISALKGNFKMEVEQTIFVTHLVIVNEMICVERRTQKKILSSRWELNP